MVYAGGSLPKRRGCTDVLTNLAQQFRRMPPRKAPRRGSLDRTFVENSYIRSLEEATEMGCLGMEKWGTVAPYIKSEFDEYLKKMDNLTVTLSKFSDTVRDVTIQINRQELHGRKARKRGPRNKIATGIVSKISDWVLHCLSKYASKAGPNWPEGAKASLRRSPPAIDADDLTQHYVSQFEALKIKTPFSREMCPKNQEQCNDWNETIPGFWSHGTISGETLEDVIRFVDQAQAMIDPGDWRLLAQISQVWGATGFDSMGYNDNSDWDCEKVAATCEVHPSCARAAAQMLTSPWAGTKKYASSWGSKIKTYLGSKGKFDEDGFHSYCHAEGEGYCWSYTDCIQEMMKWLCHDEATADRCCPNPWTKQVCKKDVNSDQCKVCLPPNTQMNGEPVEEDNETDHSTIARQAPDP